jgi:hypothetical protein
VAAKVVSYIRVEWAIDSFAPIQKSRNGQHIPGHAAGRMESAAAGRLESAVPYLVRNFCACLSTVYVPAMW